MLAERHPQTGFVFEGAILPFWDELKELVGRAARALVPLRALGWDIAICPDGPRVVEANQHYDIFLMQELSGGLRETPIGQQMAAEYGWRTLESDLAERDS